MQSINCGHTVSARIIQCHWQCLVRLSITYHHAYFMENHSWPFSWVQFSSVELSSVAQSCLTLCNPMNHSMPGLPVHHQLPEFTQTHVHQVGDAIWPSHLILCCPLLLLPLIPPSIRVFSKESTLCMRWPKYWSFSFSIIPSKEIPGLISFRIDWLYLLAVQGTLKSLLQHHSSKASCLEGFKKCSANPSDLIFPRFRVCNGRVSKNKWPAW